jgi:peroxiredoxin
MLLKNTQVQPLPDTSQVFDRGSTRIPASRLLRLALPLGVGLVLLVASVTVLASMSGWRSSTTVTQAAPAPTAKTQSDLQSAYTDAAQVFHATSTDMPGAQPAESGQPDTVSNADMAGTDIVVSINGRPIGQDTLRLMQAADQAMATLLGQPVPTGHDLIDRLVNGELVRRAAEAAGFTLPASQISNALQDFLTARNKTLADLEERLTAHTLTLDDFEAYFGQLLLIGRFSEAQAASQAIPVSGYLDQLQRDAHISFGPAAESFLAQLPPANIEQPPVETQAQMQTPTLPDYATAVEPATETSAANALVNMPRGTGTGQLAPLFDLPAINDPASDLLSLAGLSGKPTLVSFWTTWCPYCKHQTPALVDAFNRYADKGVQFIGINVKENQAQVENYITANGMPYPVGLDTDGQIAHSYGVSGFPTTFFLDAKGRVVARHVGQLSAEKVDSYLRKLLTSENP